MQAIFKDGSVDYPRLASYEILPIGELWQYVNTDFVCSVFNMTVGKILSASMY